MAAQAPWLLDWPGDLLTIAVLLGLSVVARPAVRFAWRRVLVPVARRTPTTLDITLLSSTEEPVGRAAFWLVVYAAAAHVARLPALAGTVVGSVLEGVFYAIAALAVTRLALAAVDGLARWYLTDIAHRTSTPLDEHFIPVVTRVAAIAGYFIAATVVLARFDVNVTALVTTAGVASLAVALAAQETLANMFAGFTILLDRSYRVGDRIQLPDGTVGDVYEIGLRATKILSFDHELIIVPNKEMTSARIVNQSYPDLRVKVRPRVRVSYSTDIEKAKQVMLEVCLAHPKVLRDPPPTIYFTDFGDSSLNLLGLCWVADYRDRFQVLDELNVAIKKRFDEEGIEIPFPQRDLHLRSSNADLGQLLGLARDRSQDSNPEAS